MPPLTIESTTDSKEAVTAALGDLAKTEVPVVDESQSASSEKTEGQEETKESKGIEASSDEKTEDSETSDDEETKEESEESEEGKKDKKAKPGFKRRIDKLNARLSAEQQEKDFWRTEALKNKTPAKADGEVKVATVEGDGRPKVDDFKTHAEYVEALTDWKVDQKFSKEKSDQKQNELKGEYQKTVKTFQDKIQEFSKKHDDFNDLVEGVEDIPMSLTVQDVILRSEVGPELMYELAKNREEYQRICGLPVVDAARAIGKIEERLAKNTETSKTKTEAKSTKAPNPINPVGAKASGNVKKSIYDEDLSQKEFERMREKQLKERNA